MRLPVVLSLVVLVVALAAGAVVAVGQVRSPQHDPVLGPAGPAPPLAPPESRSTDAQALRKRLRAVLERPELALPGGSVSLLVSDMAGRTVFAVAPEEPRLPASATKLVTAAAALMTLGPDHRFVTTVEATGAVRGSRLHGDLILRGGADPVLATPAYARDVAPDRPRTPLDRLAARVAASGITAVTGDLVADPTLLGGGALATTWKEEYLSDRDARPVGGLTVDAGLDVDPEESAVTGLARDPARRAATALRSLLAERGVEVRGAVRVAQRPTEATSEVARIASPPLGVLLGHMVRESDNHLADTLLRTVGASLGGDGSWDSAGAAASAVLEHLGVGAEGAVLADGSGLSRANRLTAGQLVALHRVMSRSRFGSLWSGLMAVAGRSGTLEERLAGTVAEGVLRGKTGSLDDVTTLVGSVYGPDGRHHDLAVLLSHAEADQSVARALVDEVVLAVAEEQRGCVRRRGRPRCPARP